MTVKINTVKLDSQDKRQDEDGAASAPLGILSNYVKLIYLAV